MKISLKLGMGFGILALFLVVIIYLAINGLSELNTETDNLVHDKYPKTVWANNVIDEINLVARCVRNILLLEDESAKKRNLKELNKQEKISLLILIHWRKP